MIRAERGTALMRAAEVVDGESIMTEPSSRWLKTEVIAS
jgi:hypothetical protein